MDSKEAEGRLRSVARRLGKVFNIVSRDEAEKADMVVCVSGADYYFDDNVFTVCADCGGCIQHRPCAPKTPPKVCFKCAQTRMENDPGNKN